MSAGLSIWEDDIETSFLLSLLYNTTFTQSTNISSYPYVPAKMDPRTTEDCLFLDVVVPKKIFDRGQQYTKRGQHKSFVPKHELAPVLVWIYGGGYVGGEKSSSDPTGLIERSQVVGDGIVYVALNYRVSLKVRIGQALSSYLIFALFLARRIWLACRRCNQGQWYRQCRTS